VDAQFDDIASSIILYGLSDDVVSVETNVQSKYVVDVCYDTLSMHLPGIVGLIVVHLQFTNVCIFMFVAVQSYVSYCCSL